MTILQGASVLAACLSLFVKEDLRRSRIEDNKPTKFDEMPESDLATRD